VTKTSKVAWLSEELCIGCGICVKKCPFEAIMIINLPKSLDSQTTHRYGPNSFKLHRLPQPRPGQVLGLVGSNGTGKSTALKILASKLKPNLGQFESPPDWEEILKYFRGSELQNYFTRVLEDELKAIVKPQYVDNIPRAISGQVGEILRKHDERDVYDAKDGQESILDVLDLNDVQERNVKDLSGGELQRFAIGVSVVRKADIYMFDEPSSYLDVKQRLNAARCIRSLLSTKVYVICVEHDLSVLDYLSDFICCLYGKPGAYGVVTMPFSVREGINIFLAGFIPTENLRFRDEALTFRVAEADERLDGERNPRYEYPAMTKTLGTFKLEIKPGKFADSEIIVLLGQNGTGKTTFIRMLAGGLESDDGTKVPELNVSYKPQKISPKFDGSVRALLHKKIRDMYIHPQFVSDVMKPLNIEALIDQDVMHLSGGELQRVAITLSLGTVADIYLIDEPSAYLDSEQRIIAAKVRADPLRGFVPGALGRESSRRVALTGGLSTAPSFPPWPSLDRLLGALPRAVTPGLRVRAARACLPCAGDQALHHALEEGGLHRRARLHHGHLPRGQSDRLRRAARGHVLRKHSADAAVGDEPLPRGARDHLQKRPRELQVRAQARWHPGAVWKRGRELPRLAVVKLAVALWLGPWRCWWLDMMGDLATVD
jgi:ATP-binding cassette subfamily E protein 1